MDRSKTTGKQLLAVLFAGLLSPMLRIVPEETAMLAGAGGWVGPLLAMPLFLLILLFVGRSLRRLPGGGGLAELYRFSYGPALGRALSVLTGLWLLVTAVSALRYYGESFLSSIYPDTDIWLFLIGLMAVVRWACRGGREAVCRMGHLFFYALLALAGTVVVLGIREVHLYHIWPVWLEGWDRLALSLFPVLGLMGNTVILLFCRGEIARERGGLRRAAAWFLGLAGVLALLGIVMIGMFGWQTAVRLQMPFFSTAKEVNVLGVFERVEAVIAATWVFSDLMLQTLLLWTGTELMGGREMREESRRRLQTVWAVAAVIGAVFLVPDAFQLGELWRTRLRWADAWICYGGPVIACLLLRLRLLGRKRQ